MILAAILLRLDDIFVKNYTDSEITIKYYD